MGRYALQLPKIGEGTTEAEIVAWHVMPGQEIREEDPLVDVMTDKATVEIPAPVGGTVVALNGAVGDKRPVGSELVTLDVAGEGNVAKTRPHPPGAAAPGPPSPALREREKKRAVSARADRSLRGNSEAAVTSLSRTPSAIGGEGGEAPKAEPGEGVRRQTAARQIGQKPLASPAVRRRAWDLGIELQFVPGTGPGGRIMQENLAAYIAAGTQPALAARPLASHDGVEEVPITGLRRAIAEHLQQSKRHIPHFSYIEE